MSNEGCIPYGGSFVSFLFVLRLRRLTSMDRYKRGIQPPNTSGINMYYMSYIAYFPNVLGSQYVVLMLFSIKHRFKVFENPCFLVICTFKTASKYCQRPGFVLRNICHTLQRFYNPMDTSLKHTDINFREKAHVEDYRHYLCRKRKEKL